MDSNDFKFVIPAEIFKGKDNEWRVAGLASTPSMDRQGEIIVQEGIDATPIDQGRGFFNWDHDNSPENTVGTLDGYKKMSKGLYVEGRLFKNHTRAKAVHEIMTSLNKNDKGRVGMSVEGKVIERDPNNPRIIKRCIIKNVALTLNPVNQDTFTDIIKSMSSAESSVEFESTGQNKTNTSDDGSSQQSSEPAPTFTVDQVLSIMQKALSISSGNSAAPNTRSGGDALGKEELDKKPKKLKKMSKEIYKSNMIKLLDKIQELYPNNTRTEIWEAIKVRMQTKFPEIENF